MWLWLRSLLKLEPMQLSFHSALKQAGKQLSSDYSLIIWSENHAVNTFNTKPGAQSFVFEAKGHIYTNHKEDRIFLALKFPSPRERSKGGFSLCNHHLWRGWSTKPSLAHAHPVASSISSARTVTSPEEHPSSGQRSSRYSWRSRAKVKLRT